MDGKGTEPTNSAAAGQPAHQIEASYRTLLLEQPADPMSLWRLGRAAWNQGDNIEAIRLFKQAIFFSPGFSNAHKSLLNAYRGTNQRHLIPAVYLDWFNAIPDDPEAAHMRAAITGQSPPVRCSDAYVQQHFNDFSTSFDQVLTKSLGYRAPEALAAALIQNPDVAGRTVDMLDAGCGTGLCGPLLRDRCARLVGVDLADKMLEQAGKRDCYDELIQAELCAFMNSHSASFDAVVSADVLIYFGALEPFFRAAHRALRPDGFLAISMESLDEHTETGFRLKSTGRYAHSEAYARATLREAGFKVTFFERQILRREGGKDVPGHIVVARRT